MKKYLLAGGLIWALAGLPGGAASAVGAPAPAASDGITGKVAETINAATYTYVLIDTGTKKIWAAAPQFAVKVGDAIAVVGGMPMMNYQSKTLNRTFDVVYFTGDVRVNGERTSPVPAAELPKDHPPTGKAPAAAPNLTGIKRAANGQTVAEIFSGKAKLVGQPVAIRGRVVKFNAMIMGKNWIHLRDGSGAEGTNDLTVTTDAAVKVGDLVVVTGPLSANRDFGGGYKYDLIVEGAKVVVE